MARICYSEFMNVVSPPPRTVDIEVSPRGTMEVLSQREVEQLRLSSAAGGGSGLSELFRRCALAVLNTGNEEDDAAAIFDRYHSFSIEIVQRTRGVKLKIRNAPASAFVDGRIVEGIRQHLFAVLRDLVYIGAEIERNPGFDLTRPEGVTDAVFHILKHAGVLDPSQRPNLVVCWGGHSVSRTEYDYAKGVGYHLGLRGLDVCTGCGPGAMKGPMKGAALGHAKQRLETGRYVGLTEPGIIAAEPPNPIVNRLVVLPDIEKRLEAFLRIGHGVVVFPGGAGTAEEILFLLGVLMDPSNADQKLPVVLTGPTESRPYLDEIDRFVTATLGEEARSRYRIIVDDAAEAARHVARHVRDVHARRRRSGDAYYFNWLLKISEEYQRPFHVSHETVAELVLNGDQPPHELVSNLRRAFSAIVAGNVREEGIRMVRERGPFEIRGDAWIVRLLDDLLASFVTQGRMKIAASTYEPCYRLVPG